MSEDEKADMLADLSVLICRRLSTTVEEVHSYFKIYPELHDILSFVIDVSFIDKNLIQVLTGRKDTIEERIKAIQEKLHE